MFEGVRRTISHRREAKAKGRLRRLEKERRLSYIKMRGLQERKSAEIELGEQVGAELSAHRTARQALRERRQTEKELRALGSRGVGMRTIRGVGRVTKGVLYDFPVRAVRAGSKLGKGTNLNRILIGDTRVLTGRPKGPSGPRPQAPTPKRGKSLGIFEIDRDVLK